MTDPLPLHEPPAELSPHVLVQPDVTHLVKDQSPGHRVHERRVDIDVTVQGETEMTITPRGLAVEPDLDPCGRSPAISDRPAAHRTTATCRDVAPSTLTTGRTAEVEGPPADPNLHPAEAASARPVANTLSQRLGSDPRTGHGGGARHGRGRAPRAGARPRVRSFGDGARRGSGGRERDLSDQWTGAAILPPRHVDGAGHVALSPDGRPPAAGVPLGRASGRLPLKGRS